MKLASWLTPFYCIFCLEGEGDLLLSPPNTPEPLLDPISECRMENAVLKDENLRLKWQMETTRVLNRNKFLHLKQRLADYQELIDG